MMLFTFVSRIVFIVAERSFYRDFMITQMLQTSEFFHNGYIADIQNSTTPEIVKRSAWYRARLV